MTKVTAYTDGSANWKNKLGGCGIYIKTEDSEFYFNKGFSNTKTGRMELRAMIIALQKITDKSSIVTIYSDSQYAVKCISEERLWKWERFVWQGVANVDLLESLLFEVRKFRIRPKAIHIKGHQDNIENEHVFGNNCADILAGYKNFKEFEDDTI